MNLSSKNFFTLKIFIFLCLPPFLLGQGTYYNGIDTASASFVTDLHNLINPHTRISYDQFDETNVANFASRDTTAGQKVVTCVYSGENYVYTPPFTWAVYSREHTWCQSWMPSVHASGFTNLPEYSDQHHLFPTNQNHANAVRSNHPLGIVTTPTGSNGTFFNARFGTNSIGQIVYEPRGQQKGDAARTLLYMALCYNGVGGYNWTFNNLNRVLVDSLSEAAQDLNLLLQWHDEDPPDAWEISRNNYVYSLQGNRNPFVDHPEYVGKIDFTTLTKKTIVPLAAEPTNYPTNFIQGTITSSSVQLTWTKSAAGSQSPSGYLLIASSSSSIAAPVNGTIYPDDTNLSDGSARVNLDSSISTYTFTGLPTGSTFYFKLFPYNGTGGARSYKTNNFPDSLSINSATSGSVSTGNSISISSNTFSYSQDFNSLASSGTSNAWTNDGTIFGWYSSVSNYDAGTGSSNAGKLYSFGSAANRALGSIASGSTGTIYYGVKFTNNSGVTITTIPINYTGEQWRNGGNTTPQKLRFEYKINAASLSQVSGWTAVPALDFIGPIASAIAGALDGTITDNKIVFSSQISVSLLNGNDIWFRWTDPNDAGNDHGLSIEDFKLNEGGNPMPVELTFLKAITVGNQVFLQWQTATETNNFGFEIERRTSQVSSSLQGGDERGRWKKIGFVEGNGTTNAPKSYAFTDNLLSGKVSYRLKQFDRDGKFQYSQEIEVNGSTPKRFSLSQNYPNPFNPETTIRFDVAKAEHVTMIIYNSLGQKVITLVNKDYQAGTYDVRLNASSLSSGTYFYRYTAGEFTATKSFMLLK